MRSSLSHVENGSDPQRPGRASPAPEGSRRARGKVVIRLSPRRDRRERRAPNGERTARPARPAESCLSYAQARPCPARGTQLSVIVVDASAILEVLLRTPVAPAIEERLFERGETLHAPHLLDLEVLQVLRRYAAAGEISAERAREALDDLAAFRLRRWAHDALALRIWELRQNLTAYDAAYVALAEALGAPLLTRDRRLASAPGIRAPVEVP